jgi:Uma2 family endonuclease
MNIALRGPMTRDEFLDWAESQAERYEFDGFQPVAMTGGNATHNRLQRRLMRLLEDRLAGGPCEPFGPDLGVETVGNTIRYPDALIACGPALGKDKVARNVVAVFEVLSEWSCRTDRIVKVREYQAVETIRRYAIIEQDSAGVTVFEKDAMGTWLASVLTGSDVLRMPEVDLQFAIADLYEGIDLPVDPSSRAE